MIGAVLYQEMLLAGRRQRAHFLRWIYAALLLMQLLPAALGRLASVWCRQTRDAVLCTYLVLLAGCVFVWFGGGTRWAWLADDLNPWRALAFDDPWQWAVRLTRFLTAWLVPGGLCVLLAAWRLRPAYLRQLRSTHSARRRWWHAGRPRIRGNPVAWRERYVLGIAPL